MNILIVKFGALGDVVRTSYILPGLKKKYPRSKIFWFTSEISSQLIDSNFMVNKIFTPKNQQNLKTIKFDYVISLDDELEILKTLRSLGIEVDVGSYEDQNGNASYTDNSSLWFDMGLISSLGKEEADRLKKKNNLEHNDILSRILDIDIDEPHFCEDISLHPLDERFTDRFFKIGLNLGAGERWPSKKLRMTEAVELVRELKKMRIKEKNTQIYLLGGESEKGMNQALEGKFSKELVNTGHLNTLKEFAKIISSMDLIISSDSLALHLAIAQKIKTVSFFSPTSSAEIGTFGTGIKLKSLSDDYCSYVPNADNSTITAERIIKGIKSII